MFQFQKVRLLLLITLCHLLIFHILLAQKNPSIVFTNLSTEDGLPSSEVHCIFQDSRGYMWFGTDNGASKYDGYNFTNFGAKEGLMNNVVLDIFEDKKGNVWLGTMGGQVFIYDGDSIKPYKYNQIINSLSGKTGGSLVYLDENETAYLDLKGMGILKIDSSGTRELIKGKIPQVTLIMNLGSQIRTIISYYIDYSHPNLTELFEKQQAMSMSSFEIVSVDTSVLIQLENDKMPGRALQYINNKFLIIFLGGTLYILEDNKIIFKNTKFPETNEIYVQPDGSIFFSLHNNKGYRKYSSIEAIKNNQYQSQLNGHSLTQIYKDRMGGLWYGSLNQGVFYCKNPQIEVIDKQSGMTDHFIVDVAFSPKMMYLGVKNGVIYGFDRLNSNITDTILFNRNSDTYDLNYIETKDKLFLGFIKLEYQNKILPLINDYNLNELQTSFLFSLKDSEVIDDSLIIGSFQTGILKYNIQKNIFRNINEQEFIRYFGLFKDRNGTIWTSEAGGLFTLDLKTEKFTKIDGNHPVFNSRIEEIEELPDGSLLLGSKGYGLVRWNGELIQEINTTHGLASNMIEDIVVDDEGVCWVGTLNGLSKLTFTGKSMPEVRSFSIANGLPSNEINEIELNNKEVWLCTTKGLVNFIEPTKSKFVPKPSFDNILVNNSSFDANALGQLNHTQNNINFHYTTLNYKLSGNINYRFKVKSSQEWQYSNNRTANFSALAPDDYSFEVQSQNEDGKWSDSLNQPFSIHPAWWNTTWFRTLAFLGAGFLMYSIYKNRTKQIRRENDLQKQMDDLKLSAFQAQMNPHFIFNCLNSIQNFILQNDQMKAVDFLSRFARLIRLNLNASVRGTVSIEEEIDLLGYYLSLEQERFEQRFEYVINASDAVRNDLTELPALIIQPFVENAVIHGMDNKDGNGKIEIIFRKENDVIFIEIIDNGPGLTGNDKSVSKHEYDSVGMSITNKRIALSENSASAQIKVDSSSGKNNIGTRILLTITPKQNQNAKT